MRTILIAATLGMLSISAASAQPYYAGPDAGYFAGYGAYDAMNYPPEPARRSNLNPRDPSYSYTGEDAVGDDYYSDQTMR